MHPTIASFAEEHGVNIVFKDNSLLMRLINIFYTCLLFIPNLLRKEKISFMRDYYTTIGKTIYLPEGSDPRLSFPGTRGVFRHELIHVMQYLEYGVWFYIMFLFPNCLFFLGFLGLLNPWLFFLFALLLIPYGPFRLRWEMEAVVFESIASGRAISDIIEDFRFWVYLMPTRKVKAIAIANVGLRKIALAKV